MTRGAGSERHIASTASIAVTVALCALVLPPAVAQEPAFALQARAMRGLKAEVATLIVAGGEGGALPFSVLPLPELGELAGAGDEGAISVPILLELEGMSLFQAEDAEPSTIEFYLYAIDGSGSVAAYTSQRVDIDLEDLGEPLYETGLKLVTALPLEPGDYDLRALAREPHSRRYSVRSRPMTVAAADDDRPRLSPPLLAEPPDRWLAVRPPGAPELRASPDWGLLGVGPEQRLASALPVIEGGEAELEVVAFALPEPVKVLAQLEDKEGGEGGQAQVEVLSRETEGRAERLRLRLVIGAVSPGSYLLRLSAEPEGRGGQSARVSSPAIEVVVLPELDREDLVWGELRHLFDRSGAGRRVAELDVPRGPRRRRAEIDPVVRDRYEQVLARYVSDGSSDAALDLLVAAESEVFAADPVAAADRLRDTELAIAQRVGEVVAEGLLPLAVMHLHAYRAHRQQRSYALATHARNMAAILAELYVATVGEDAKQLASATLACLAADMSESRLWKQSEQVVRRAVEIDDQNELALLLMASNRERFGDYAEVVQLTRKAVELNPRSHEARLRLAINLRRVGREGEAARTLRQLVNSDGDEWLLVLGHEELARLRINQGRLAEAAEGLRLALSRFPSHQGLYVELAYVLERSGRPDASREVLSRLPVASPAFSPRYVYAQPRTEIFDPVREDLALGASVRAPLVGHALAEAGQGRR